MKDDGLTELHIVNGLHPTLPWKYYPRVLRELKAALPDVALKCFTATEIHFFEEISGLSADAILDELIDAGLESLTGGGAEIFDWDVRKQIVDHKTHWEDWSRIHRLAHGKGLRTPATMLYGHIEEPRHRVDHVLRLRELQDETGGFVVFIPLRFHNDNNRLSHLPMAQPADVLKTFAVSPPDARQLRPRQGVLGHARSVDVAAGAELRRRRHGRLGGRVQDHARRRPLRHARTS